LEPRTVPEVLKTSINFKILGLFLVAAIAFQTFLYFSGGSDEIEEGVAYLSMSTPLIVAGGSLLVATRYGLSQVFGKAYLLFAHEAAAVGSRTDPAAVGRQRQASNHLLPVL